MRIVAGTARGRVIRGPRSKRGIRPTADRVRETLFNVLGQWLDGKSVLDLFAGTGALSLEALSRRANRAVLVDDDPEAVALCRMNAGALGFAGSVEILSAPVAVALRLLKARRERFDVAFADPPYAAGVVRSTLEGVSDLIAPAGVFCIEHSRHEAAPEGAGDLVRFDARRFGETLVTLYRVA